MIVADPYGSWVSGARAGVQDALALRHGADQSALANYGLERSRQFDPYELAGLQAKTRMENVNADIAQQFGAPMAQANLESAQAHTPESLATFGAYGPLLQYLQARDPSLSYSPEGGARTFLRGVDGGQIPYVTPTANIRSPQDIMMQLRALGITDLNQWRAGQLDARNRAEDFRETGGAGPARSSSVFGSGIPGAKVPSGSYNAPYPKTELGPIVTGGGVGGAGANIYSDVQNKNIPQVPVVPRGKNNPYGLAY